MVFAETSDRKTNARLTGSKAKHVIFGAPSGPVVMMRLKQMQRGQEEAEDQKSAAERGTADESGGDDQVRITGSLGKGGGAIHLKSSGGGDAPSSEGDAKPAEKSGALSRLMSALADSDQGRENSIDESIEDITKAAQESRSRSAKAPQGPIIQQGIGRGKSALFIPTPDPKKKAKLKAALKSGALRPAEDSDQKEQRRALSAVDSKNRPAREHGSAGADGIKAGRPNSQLVTPPLKPAGKVALRAAIESGALKAAESRRTESASKSDRKLDPKSAGKSAATAARDSGAQAKSESAATERGGAKNPSGGTPSKATEHDAQTQAKSQNQHRLHEAENSTATPGTSRLHDQSQSNAESQIALIERCIRDALTSTCGRPRDSRDTLLEYRTASVLVLTSNGITGSIMIAVGAGTFDHQAMLRTVETEFLKLLSDRGFDFSVGEMNSYPIHPAQAAEDAFTAAEFAVVSRSESTEVGMAFLNLVPSEPVIVETADKMLEVQLDDIAPDTKLMFDVFLYLPANQKYLRYLKVDTSMSQKQSQRLNENEVKTLYLKKDSVEAFKQHAAIGDLKRKITKKAA